MQTWIEENIREHRKSYIFQGILFVVLGIAALLVPGVAAEFFELLIGCLLVITGLVQALSGYSANRHFIVLFSALASVVAGILLLVWPDAGLLVLAAIIGIFLFVQGIFQIITAAVYAPFRGWMWMLASGVVTLGLSIVIYAGWPITGIWLLGVLIGINFLFFGMTLLMIVNAVK